MNIHRIGIVGTGVMGTGIAQVLAQGGFEVLLFDAAKGVADQARHTIASNLAKLAEKGKLNERQCEEALSRIKVATGLIEFASVQLVVESITENLEAKRQIFAALETVVAEDCLLTTNTGSLSVTAITAACQLQQRTAGLHFSNPVPRMKVVEVVAAPATAPFVLDTLVELIRGLDYKPIRTKDAPGLVINHAGCGLVTEALRLLEEQVADFYDIDRIMRDMAGFPMGPCELMDLTGMDESVRLMESIYYQFYEEPRYRPSSIAKQRLMGGLIGRRSGRGFYRYQDAQTIGPAEALKEFPPPVLDLEALPPLWISQAHPEFGHAVHQLVAKLGARIETGLRPSNNALCIVTPRGLDAASCASNEGLDARRTVAIDAVFGLETGKRRTLMTTPATSPRTRKLAHALFAADGTPVTVIRDSAGFVAQRIVAHIINIGCEIAQHGVASPEDIDHAVVLGLGYPKGPLALGDAIGPKRVLDILDCLSTVYRDPRYRASPWLRRRALLGASLLTPEA